jgi:hypothetical protein
MSQFGRLSFLTGNATLILEGTKNVRGSKPLNSYQRELPQDDLADRASRTQGAVRGQEYDEI